jgi:hypothetical protein
MDAIPIDPAQADRTSLSLGDAAAAVGGDATAVCWAALHDAAAVVAAMAGHPPEPVGPRIRAVPAAMAEADGLRRERAARGVEDIRAMMEPGLTALLAIHGRGADTAAPAAALLDEFRRARDGVVDLVLPDRG